MKTSARNAFRCTVVDIRRAPVNVEVILRLSDSNQLTAIVTNQSANDLELDIGREAIALVKSSFVMLARADELPRVSARNRLSGVVIERHDGGVNSEITMDIGEGKTLTAVITRDSADSLPLTVNDRSANRKKAKAKIARLHARISNIRKDGLHKLTTELLRRFAVIGVEDLNVRGMMANGKLARSIADRGFHEFRRQLDYKAVMAGSRIDLGVKPLFFRPPYGGYDEALVQEAYREGMQVILWSHDSQDWHYHSLPTIEGKLLTPPGKNPHGVFLFHDVHDTTIAAMPAILDELRTRGCHFVTMNEWTEHHLSP